MSVRLRLAVGIPLFVLFFFYLCLRAYLGGVAPQQYSRRGWDAEWREGRAVITNVGGDSPATEVVRKGDVVIDLRSERPAETPVVATTLWRVPPGAPYKLVVSRDGQSLEFSLHTTRVYTGVASGWPFVFVILTFLLFLVTGATVFLLKPGDEQAWLLALMLTSLTSLFPLSIYLRLPG